MSVNKRQKCETLTRYGLHQSSAEMRVSAAACGSGLDKNLPVVVA